MAAGESLRARLEIGNLLWAAESSVLSRASPAEAEPPTSGRSNRSARRSQAPDRRAVRALGAISYRRKEDLQRTRANRKE